jgi:phosphohistidine phosphatase SixA
MRVFLIHHADAMPKEEDPGRHLSEKGRDQCARIAAQLKQAGVLPVKILHSDKQWTTETAERIGEALGISDRTAQAGYPIGTDDDIAPFIAEIEASGGDIMMCGHFDYLTRTVSKLVCGDENAHVAAFKPGNGTTMCLDNEDDDWTLTYAWRVEHLAAA